MKENLEMNENVSTRNIRRRHNLVFEISFDQNTRNNLTFNWLFKRQRSHHLNTKTFIRSNSLHLKSLLQNFGITLAVFSPLKWSSTAAVLRGL